MEYSKTKEFIFRSKLADIEEIPKHLPLHTYCFEKLDEVRDRPCIIDGPTGKIYTHGDVEIAARRVASGLAKLGISQRDVVMLLLPNCPEFAFVFFGVSFRGATATTANPLYTSWEISKQARACKAKMVVTQSAYAGKLFELREVDGVKVVCVDDDDVVLPDGCLAFSCLKDVDEKEMESVEVLPEDVVALPYSSGTTGMPKGVMLTHRGMVTDAAQHVDGQNPNVYMTRDDVVLCVLPLFHVYSLSILLAGIRAGSAVVVMAKFEIATMMELVQRHRVSVAPIVPPIVVAMVKSPAIDAYDLTSIRVVMSRAAPLGKELQDALRAKMPKATLGQGYGMTEAGPVISMCLAFAKEPFPIKSGSCGTVVRNAQLKIVDPITGLSLPRNQAGEICVRGPQIMKGYLNDPEATARTIDKEGWLHTGDIGLVDDDDELFIVDRLKELIKYKGFQVAPAELEALLLAHPSVADAAVVPMKDSTAGEIPVAFVVRSNGSEVTEDDIKKFIAKQVVFYKKLHKVFFVEAIPKAPSGKILRRELRARLARVARVEREGLSVSECPS